MHYVPLMADDPRSSSPAGTNIREQGSVVGRGDMDPIEALALGSRLLAEDVHSSDDEQPYRFKRNARKKLNRRRRRNSGTNEINGEEPWSPPSPTLTAHRPPGRVGQVAEQVVGELGAVYLWKGGRG